MSRPLVAFTPNLALDRTMRLDRPLRPGRLHRVRDLRVAAGGKGVNLARTVRALGGEVTVAGFLAGWNGRKFRASLEAEGLRGEFVEVTGETRECHILLDEAEHPTEINEGGTYAPAEAWWELARRLPEGRLVLSGSLPPGMALEELRGFVAGLAEPPVVDVNGPALAAALEGGASLISPNRAELAVLVGRDTATLEDAVALYDTRGVPVLLTMGAEGAAYVGEERYVARAPAVEAMNPVGSGDCLLGAFLWSRGEGHAPCEALRWGVAAGSDNSRRGGGGTVVRAGIEELLAAVVCEEVP